MWAWERMTASTSEGGKAKFLLRSAASDRRPWYMPQSRRKRLPPVWISCEESVTVRAAPRKVICMILREYSVVRGFARYNRDVILLRGLVVAAFFSVAVWAEKKPVTLAAAAATERPDTVSPIWSPDGTRFLYIEA